MNARWFNKRQGAFRTYMETCGVPPTAWINSHDSVRKQAQKQDTPVNQLELASSTSEFSVRLDGVLGILLGVNQSKMREEFGVSIDDRVSFLFSCFLQDFVPDDTNLDLHVECGDSAVVVQLRGHNAQCVPVAGEPVSGLAHGQCQLSRELHLFEFTKALARILWRPSRNQSLVGIATEVIRTVCGVVAAGAELAVAGAVVFERYNLLALDVRRSSQKSLARVPKGVKRAFSIAAAEGEGLSKTNQMRTSAQLLRGEGPLQKRRVTSKEPVTNARSSNRWCIDVGSQYILHSREHFKIVPEVTGMLLDGSGYSCKDYNHTAIFNPDTRVCLWLPPSAPLVRPSSK